MVQVTSNSNYCIPEVKKLVANNKVPFELEALTMYLTTQRNPRLSITSEKSDNHTVKQKVEFLSYPCISWLVL